MSKGDVVGKCPITGLDVIYSGRGRPPKYHPDARKAVLAAQRKAYRDRQKAKRAE